MASKPSDRPDSSGTHAGASAGSGGPRPKPGARPSDPFRLWLAPLIVLGVLAAVLFGLRVALFTRLLWAWMILVPLSVAAAGFLSARQLPGRRGMAWGWGAALTMAAYVLVIVFGGVLQGSSDPLNITALAGIALALCLPAGPLGVWLGTWLGAPTDLRPSGAAIRRMLDEQAGEDEPAELFCAGRRADGPDRGSLWIVAPMRQQLLLLKLTADAAGFERRISVPYDDLDWSLVHAHDVFRITIAGSRPGERLVLNVLDNRSVRRLRNEDAAMDVGEAVHRCLAPIAGRQAIRDAKRDHSSRGRSGERKRADREDAPTAGDRRPGRRSRSRRPRREDAPAEAPMHRGQDDSVGPVEPVESVAPEAAAPKQHEPILPLDEDELADIRDFATDGEPLKDDPGRPDAPTGKPPASSRNRRSRGGRQRRPRSDAPGGASPAGGQGPSAERSDGGPPSGSGGRKRSSRRRRPRGRRGGGKPNAPGGDGGGAKPSNP